MRISDWSSDVCSSDLPSGDAPIEPQPFSAAGAVPVRPRWQGPRGSAAAWCLYDWANSSYPTVIVTFVFAAYFTRGVAVSPEEGTAQWGLMLSLSGVALAVLAPVLGALAAQGGEIGRASCRERVCQYV